MSKSEILKPEHKEEFKKRFFKSIQSGLIDFEFVCWNHQGFKDACGKPIPKKDAIYSLKKHSKSWDNWINKTPYH